MDQVVDIDGVKDTILCPGDHEYGEQDVESDSCLTITDSFIAFALVRKTTLDQNNRLMYYCLASTIFCSTLRTQSLRASGSEAQSIGGTRRGTEN